MRGAHERLQDRAHGGSVRVRPLVTRRGRLGGPAATLTGGHSRTGQEWSRPLPLSGANPTAGLTRLEPGTR
jgi:hypothetical protein